MNKTESFFVETLCAFLTEDGKKLNTDGVDRQELYTLAKRHSVAGILSYVFSRYQLFEGESISEKFTTQYEKTLSVMLRRSLAAENISRLFSQHGIAHIPFKGSTVARFYPVPELRAYSDVDMIVKEEDLSKIDEIMSSRGFLRSIADMGVVTCYKKGMEYYEFHKSLNIPDDEKEVFSSVWENSAPLTDCLYALDDSFLLCYLISHLEKHMRSGGAGVKMYLDIALFLKNSKSLDFEKVREILKAASLYSFFESVLWLCHKWFLIELPFEVTPMEDRLYSEFCSFTLSDGVFGDHTKEGGLENALMRVSSGSKKCAKFRFIMSRVFPAKEELYRIYPRYEGKTLLVPVAWFTHLFSFLKKDKMKNIKAVVRTDSKAANARREFLDGLGCKN